jgi:acetoacetyl-CoA synthetase
MKEDAQPRYVTPDLITSLKSVIQEALSPRHVPKYVFEVPEIAHTLNGKKFELAVKQIVSRI